MKKIKTIILVLLTVYHFIHAQKNNQKIDKIPLKSESWEFMSEAVEFIEYKSRPIMKLLTDEDEVILKDFNFSDGTIEFDIELLEVPFTTFLFRRKDLDEKECFYFRNARAGNNQAVDAIQYAPFIDGVNLWDMLYDYQSNADFEKNKWTHVKLVISGKQMRVYINDMLLPQLVVPKLEGNTTSGTIAFQGKSIISNLVVKHNITEGINPEAGVDPTINDPRYFRKWQVSEPINMAQDIDFDYTYFPNDETNWEGISSERMGLVNLTRKFGKTDGRRIVWLKTVIHSDKEQDKMIRLGFSDEVWVVANDSPVYLDKNLYNTPMSKHPDGRCSIENTSFKIPLKKGNNQLIIGVSNFFYGWGIIARLDNLDGIKIE